jgi:F-type H+-transporting ATPase subunit alpha
VNRVRAFEDGLLHALRSKGSEILEDIRKTGDLTDATADRLKAAVTEFAKSFA